MYCTTGRIQRKKCGGNRSEVLNEEIKTSIKNWVDENCTISLKSLTEKVTVKYGLTVCENTINRALEGFYYSIKQTSLIPTRRNNDAALSARRDYALNYIEVSWIGLESPI